MEESAPLGFSEEAASLAEGHAQVSEPAGLRAAGRPVVR